MKNSNFWQALKFLLFSISAGVIQIVSFTILNEFVFVFERGVEYGWSYFIFKSANNVPLAMFLVFCYYLVFTPLSIWWGVAMTNAGINEYLVTAFSMIVNFVTEFLFQKFVVFRNSINSAVNLEEERHKKIIKLLKSKF